jgi:predicted phosphate transport protein (TIGR00153 family)
MARHETNYFKLLSESADYGLQAVKALSEMLHDYNNVETKVLAIHEIEQAADGKQHILYADLMRAFITPLDRDDILELGSALDTVTDSIDDIAKLFDRFSIRTVPQEALVLCDMITHCTEGVVEAVKELSNFKRPKRLCELCVDINKVEEEGDRFHHKVIKDLLKNASDIEAIKWKEIYDSMEVATDACENVADVIERVLMKNS